MSLKHAIIFVRVYNKEQDYPRHLAELRAAALRQKVQVIAEIIDRDSVSRANQPRKGLQQLLELCRKGNIQKVLIKDVHHLYSTEPELQKLIKELTQLRISIYLQSFGEYGTETFTNGVLNQVFMSVLRTVALNCPTSNREILRGRILQGQEKARQQGKTTGRPVGTIEKQAAFLAKYPSVIQQLKQNVGVRETARFCGVAINTVSKVKALL